MDSQERTAKLNALGSAIARAITNLQNPLASSWCYKTPTEDTYQTYCYNADGARIYFQFAQGNEGRLSISGWLHIGENQQYVQVYDAQNNRLSTGEITVALERGAENIAKDIIRRFLPHYLEVYALAQRKVAADAAYKAKITTTLNTLSDAAGFRHIPSDVLRRGEITRENSGSVNGYYTKIIASAQVDDQQINIDNLTTKQVIHILNYLKGQPHRDR